MTTERSIMMDKLYGKEVATTVYDRCQELGDNFNRLVQKYVYDVFWARSGLPLKEKSLITIISLAALNKVEQLQIHVKGFFHQGGTAKDIKNILAYMESCGYISSADSVLKNLGPLIPISEKQTSNSEVSLSPRDRALIDFSSHIALGNNEKTEAYMHKLLRNKTFSRDDIENIMLHQIVYCGFPCAMNGYAVLQKIENTAEQKNTFSIRSHL